LDSTNGKLQLNTAPKRFVRVAFADHKQHNPPGRCGDCFADKEARANGKTVFFGTGNRKLEPFGLLV
jgi:hypothetical protein